MTSELANTVGKALAAKLGLRSGHYKIHSSGRLEDLDTGYWMELGSMSKIDAMAAQWLHENDVSWKTPTDEYFSS